MKVLSEHLALPAARERFLGEHQTTAKLNHPNAALLKAGTTRCAPERPFYVKRLIDGETLRDIIAGDRSPLTRQTQQVSWLRIAAGVTR